MNTHILVATDGREEALGALRLAARLSRSRSEGVRVLGVIEPVFYYGFGSEYSPPSVMDTFFNQQVEALRESIQRQVVEVVGTALEWPIRIEVGSPAPTIVRVAAETGATLIALGHGKHEPLERWFGTETARSVVQLAHVPVLAVPGAATALPRKALVAVDFSNFSREAAFAALDLVADEAEVHLVHVSWTADSAREPESMQEWVQTYSAGAIVRLEELADELRDRRSVHVRTRLISGDPARALLALAEEIGAELIAAGSHGHGFFGRLILGSVSTRLLRGARCSMLIVPSRTVPAELHTPPNSSAEREAHVLGTSLPKGVLP